MNSHRDDPQSHAEQCVAFGPTHALQCQMQFQSGSLQLPGLVPPQPVRYLPAMPRAAQFQSELHPAHQPGAPEGLHAVRNVPAAGHLL